MASSSRAHNCPSRWSVSVNNFCGEGSRPCVERTSSFPSLEMGRLASKLTHIDTAVVGLAVSVSSLYRVGANQSSCMFRRTAGISCAAFSRRSLNNE